MDWRFVITWNATPHFPLSKQKPPQTQSLIFSSLQKNINLTVFFSFFFVLNHVFSVCDGFDNEMTNPNAKCQKPWGRPKRFTNGNGASGICYVYSNFLGRKTKIYISFFLFFFGLNSSHWPMQIGCPMYYQLIIIDQNIW